MKPTVSFTDTKDASFIDGEDQMRRCLETRYVDIEVVSVLIPSPSSFHFNDSLQMILFDKVPDFERTNISRLTIRLNLLTQALIL